VVMDCHECSAQAVPVSRAVRSRSRLMHAARFHGNRSSPLSGPRRLPPKSKTFRTSDRTPW